MLGKLKRKFILTAMMGITVMLFLLLGTINVINIYTIYDGIGETLDVLVESVDKSILEFEAGGDGTEFSFGDFMENPKSERDMILSSTFFVVEFNADGSLRYIDRGKAASLTDGRAAALGEKVRMKGKTTGGYGKYRYHISREGDGETVVFLDISEKIVSYIRVLLLSCAAGLVGWGVMLAMVVVLADKAIEPVAESMERQKRFITDAGHELKTPVAVIGANIEALELYTGRSEWSENAKKQVRHLGDLVQDLLTLSRLEEKCQAKREDVWVSHLLSEEMEGFSTAIEVKQIRLQMKTEADVHIQGDGGQLRELLTILLDNAVFYTDVGGSIGISLTGQRGHFLLKIRNTCSTLPKVPPEKLFERFYRADEARSQEGGRCGIGLSIAKAIVEGHKGSIEAEYLSGNEISFTVKI